LPSQTIKLSVLICTYDRSQLLAQCLDALNWRTTEKPDQIVIVNGGDERADQVVESSRQKAKGSSQQEIEIKLIKTVNKNLAASRNVGLPECTGDIIAMTDDDAEVYPDWITQIKRIHAEHPEAGCVGGAVIGANSGGDFLSRLSDIVTFVSPSNSTYVRTVPGVNASYKREVVEQVGPQDETLFRGEDVDYNWRVKQLGYEVLYHPDIKVVHHHRPTLKQFLRQHYMYGRAYYLVRGKWPEMYCVYPHQLSGAKSILKAIHFFVAVLYQPLQFAMRLQSWRDRIKALPVLTVNQIAWKSGMLYQKWLAR
jgi:GT2 family glycosyltransferase